MHHSSDRLYLNVGAHQNYDNRRAKASTRTRVTVMTSSEKKKLIGTNAAIWSIAILASFILPFIADSMSSGSAKVLHIMCFALPLFLGMAISSVAINKAIGENAN